MEHFLDTVETIEDGLGFSHFGWIHLIWLAAFVLVTVANCIWYHRLGETGRGRWEKTVALLLVTDEAFKVVCLLTGKQFLPDYLPLHLCSINIFLILIHAWRKNQVLNNFLYMVCIPGAIAALLFPSWTALPPANFMHLHSFTVHILLAMYPLVLAVNGVLKPKLKALPGCMLTLWGMAIPIYFLNRLLDTNFMFLMFAEEGNPLYVFQQMWGNHLLGYPILIAGVVLIMYTPVLLIRKYRTHQTA